MYINPKLEECYWIKACSRRGNRCWHWGWHLKSYKKRPRKDAKQKSPIFLATGAGFVEDNFSTHQGGNGFGMIQAHLLWTLLLLHEFLGTPDVKDWEGLPRAHQHPNESHLEVCPGFLSVPREKLTLKGRNDRVVALVQHKRDLSNHKGLNLKVIPL